jgi:mannose-1-phosphate guanylyltransferase
MDRPIVAMILAGGTGTRLYPASRAARPKQLLALGGDRSLLDRTVERAGFADHRVVLTSGPHADTIRDHLREAGRGDVDVWVEPEPRDTGPALVYAAGRARGLEFGSGDRPEREPVLVCLPSDHHVAGEFGGLARRAARVAVETRGLVALGVEPDRPATGYGYVEPGREQDGYAPVRRFHEKPDHSTARELIDRGCLWNAGIFAWTPGVLLDQARGTVLEPLVDAIEEEDPERGFREVDPVSVDYAVMETTEHAFVVPADVEWDDLGTWDALARVLDSDADGNAILGDALTVDAADNVVASDDKHVAAVGVEGLVIATFDDRVLVVPRDQTQRVREVVAALEEAGRFYTVGHN